MEDTPGPASPGHRAKDVFLQELHAALASLYNPAALSRSPLAGWLGLDAKPDPARALRQSLTEAIDSLRPAEGSPRGSKHWRACQILRQRFVEQQTQRAVADHVSLSLRQLQREEKAALELLGECLWESRQLESRVKAPAASPLPEADGGAPQEDWEALKDGIPFQRADLAEILRDTLDTLRGALDENRVSVECAAASQPIVARVALLRQVLLNVFNVAMRTAPGGRIQVGNESLPGQAAIHITATAATAAPAAPAAHPDPDGLRLARAFAGLCGGSVRVRPEPPGGREEAFAATVTLPVGDMVRVLVVDDHPDALRLYQRFLSNSRYAFWGARDAAQALALARDISPQVIVLDIMMPDTDGWALLGQLHVLPWTQHVPVIVCSITPQEALALSLGAKAFLRKPVTQAGLLSALDRQAPSSARASG
jgi:CheY-like chemotaxis protein